MMPLTRSLLVLLCLTATATLQAQSTLPDLINEANANWMIGTWTGVTNDGDTISQTFGWDLNKNVVSVHVKNPGWESKGMIAVDPGTSQVQYFAVTSSGALVRGTWTEASGDLVLKMDLQSQEGRSWKGGIVYKQVDADTMKLEMYSLNSAGDLESPPRGDMTFKRKK